MNRTLVRNVLNVCGGVWGDGVKVCFLIRIGGEQNCGRNVVNICDVV